MFTRNLIAFHIFSHLCLLSFSYFYFFLITNYCILTHFIISKLLLGNVADRTRPTVSSCASQSSEPASQNTLQQLTDETNLPGNTCIPDASEMPFKCRFYYLPLDWFEDNFELNEFLKFLLLMQRP